MLFKSCPASVKAVGSADGLQEGQFEAIVSVFGNKDSYGDIVVPGAFAETLAQWKASGDPIPVYWSHQMQDPDMNIGFVVDAAEHEKGLWVRAQLDLDDGALKAKQVHRLLKGRRVTQFSFAYDVLEGAAVETEDSWYYELRKLALYEVGPTPIGANQETELLAVKSAAEHTARFVADLKAGRVLSAKNEGILKGVLDQLSGATGQLQDVLAAVESSEADDEKAKADEPAKDEGRKVKSEEPMRATPAESSQLLSITLASVDAG